MKIMLYILLFSGYVFAANPDIVITSAQPLVGALSSIPEASGSFNEIHLPGYGLELTGSYLPSSFGTSVNVEKLVGSVETILQGLSGTVQGLEQGDWISVGFEVVTDGYVVIRLKPHQPKTLETWIDGEKQ